MFPDTIAPAALLPQVIAAVADAGALIRAEFHRPGGPRGRGGSAPVDTEVETLLKTRLRALLPCGWRGEETAAIPDVRGTLWCVDPQDGTAEFLDRRRGSAVSVALIRGGQAVLGVVHAPVAPDDDGDLIAWAEGATLTRNGRPVVPAVPGDAPVVAGSPAARIAPGLRLRVVPSPAYRLALAAVGEVDAGVSMAALSSWDIAGAQALLTGAGMVLVDLEGRAIAPGRGGAGAVGGRAEVAAQLVAAGRTGPRPGRPVTPPVRPVQGAGRLARGQGCLLGLLAGDALGSAVEFQSAGRIARSHPAGVRDLTDGGTWNLIAGQPTDDGEMALALARSLVAEGGFDPAAVARAYVGWRDSGPFDIGATTAAGIAALAAGARSRSDSQANGALMRVAPLGILCAGNPARAARLAAEEARLTHPHPVCQAASAAFAAAIAAGIGGADAPGMVAAALDHAGEGPGAETVRSRIAAAHQAPPDDYQHQMGWVLTALQSAFHWLIRGATLEQALIATVGAGGDTDTNAAICGALLGAAQGRGAVPPRWRNAILSCRPGPGSRHPRPQAFWPDDALELAEALLACGG